MAADDAPLRLSPSPLEMPRRIGPLVTDGASHAYDDPRLGVSYDYRGDGLLLSLFVYDAGMEAIPDGAESMAVCQQFEDAKQGIAHAGYSEVKLEGEQLVRLSPPADSPLAREAAFELVRKDHALISYVWITGVAKYFVKLRFSLDAQLRDEAPEARRAVLNALGDAVRPHLKPADPKAGKPGTSMGFNLGKGGDDMSTQFMYMMLLGALADKPDQTETPVCGGRFVPGFETEVGIMRTLLAMAEQGATTKFDKALASANVAGFLREFVWSDLHRAEWGDSPPSDLRLDEYKPWKKKGLKRFRPPNLGEVTIDHPRALPLEAQ